MLNLCLISPGESYYGKIRGIARISQQECRVDTKTAHLLRLALAFMAGVETGGGGVRKGEGKPELRRTLLVNPSPYPLNTNHAG